MAERNINISITNKKAEVIGTPVIVCGNSDYTATFAFDDEWNLTGPRTARFVYVKDGKVQHTDVVFPGNVVAVPILENVDFVDVGVFAGNLCTTTPARVRCKKSILCGSGTPQDPTPDVYSQIMELFNEMAEAGAFGATEAQAQQIEKNKQNIAQLEATKAEQTDVASLTSAVGQNSQSITKNAQDIAQLAATKAAQTDMAALAARMDTFTHLEEGSTTGDAELADIRVGYEGTQYETAGAAVRGQVGQLSSEIVYDELILAESPDITWSTNGYRQYYDGAFVSANGFICSDSVYVREGEVFVVNGTYGNAVALISAYGENGYILGESVYNAGAKVTAVNYEYTVPGDVKRLIFSAYGSEIEVHRKRNKTVKDVADTLLEACTYDSATYRKKELTVEDGCYYSKWDGSKQAYDGGCATILAVEQGERYLITTDLNGDFAIVLRNSGGSVINTISVNQYTRYRDYEYIIPENGAKLYISCVKGKDLIVKKLELDTLKAKIEETENSIKSYWKGKKIVWFGTSIPAGQYDGAGTSYPELIGKTLGATVYNEAVPSSAVTGRSDYLISESNPYGYPNDWLYSSRILTDSVAMKQWLCNNYTNAIFTENAPATLSSDDIARVLSYSWENKLNKYLSGGEVGQADLYVFDHGYNDPRDGVADEHTYDKLVSQYGSDNLYSYIGGMNYLLRKIFSDNPNAKVIVISHYTDNYSNNMDLLVKSQSRVADLWSIPFVDISHSFGWTSQQITVDGNIKTVLEANIPDGVHPHTDTSGKATKRIAEVLVKKMNVLAEELA